MTSSLRPITWVSPLLGRLRLGASAFPDEDTARSWISLCCLATGTAADDMLGCRAEASRKALVRTPFDLTDEPVRCSRFRRLPRNRGHPLRPPRQPDNTVRIGMKQRWRSGSDERT
jgi:hypothetical protein